MSPIDPKERSEDKRLDLTLRPKSWKEYVGQKTIKDNLNVFIQAAKKRKQAPEHVLLHGPAGLGKTSLAHIIAYELGAALKITSGPAIEKAGDLGALLTNLAEGDVLFIDEAHRLHRSIEEMLYPAMEDYKLDIVIGKGPSARTLELKLPRFTLIAATTRISLLSSPLRSRFGSTHRLAFYTEDEIIEILKRSAEILGSKIDAEALTIIAQSSRSTPRVANRILKRARDVADIEGNGVITKKIAEKTLEMLEVDALGLEAIDRKLLELIIHAFSGGPVGIQTLAAAISEEKETIEDVYEPYLLQLGFLERTPRGRVATHLAYKHLGLQKPSNNQGNFL